MLNSRRYELKDHLGNVRTVITDVKLNTLVSNLPSDYRPEVMGTYNYYPFGMEQPYRNWTADMKYRYGFNGKEKDQNGEWGLTNYDYGFRIYNPAVGRFLSVDPLTRSYPWSWCTPYQFAGNKPIWAIDLDGLEEKPVNSIQEFQAKFPKLVPVNKNTTAAQSEEQLRLALMKIYYIKKTSRGYEFDFRDAAIDILKNHKAENGDEATDRLALYRYSSNAVLNNFDGLFGGQLYYKLQQQEKDWREQRRLEAFYEGMLKKAIADSRITVSDVGAMLSTIGDGTEILGYVVVAIPGGQAFGGILVATGKTVSLVGAGLETYGALLEGKKNVAYVKVAVVVASAAAGHFFEKAAKAGDITPEARAVYEYATIKAGSVVEDVAAKDE